MVAEKGALNMVRPDTIESLSPSFMKTGVSAILSFFPAPEKMYRGQVYRECIIPEVRLSEGGCGRT